MSVLSQGSVWRKWDLHIHTPASFHWNDGKKFTAMTAQEADESCKKIIEKLNAIEPVAFSVMDYFTFDGVLKIREYLKRNPTTPLKKTLFPGMELRIEAPTDFRLNIHVIFDESVTDQELQDFKGKLQILGNNRPLSRESIIQCARTLTEDKAKEYISTGDYKNNDDIAYELGCKTIRITRQSFEDAVTALGQEKCLVILPYETSNGIEKLDWKTNPHEDRYFLSKADFFESRSQANIDLFLGRETDDNKRFLKDFINTIGGQPKPVLSGSDAHKIADYGVYPSNRATWLKAEATFKGLKQVKVEPLSRCFIGEKPEKLKIISTKATKFISKIEVKKTANSKLPEAWFDNTVHFNPELVAIIGNKGSGKSALADILGLLGNSTLHENFSFLNGEKFKEKQGIKAVNYQATLTWENGDTSQKTLNEVPEKSAYEKVKYIPQSYLEKLCNEIKSKESLFDKELKAVIFSHIKPEDRLAYENLDDLLKFKTEETTKEIEKYRLELREVANQVIECREKLTEDYKKSITNKLSAKQAELKAIKDAKPKDVQKPVAGSDPEIEKSVKKLEALQKEELEVSGKITITEKEIQELTKKKASLEKAESQIKNLEQETADKVSKIKEALDANGFTDVNFFTYVADLTGLKGALDKVKADLNSKNKLLSPDEPESLVNKKENIKTEIASLAEKVDEPSKNYQKFLEETERWNKAVEQVQGDENNPDTISYYNSQLSEISNIPAKVTKLEEQRDQIVGQIYSKISGLADVYKEYYAPVQKFVESNPFGGDTFKMSFDVSIVDKGFKETFFSQINRNKVGSFYGTDNSEELIKKTLDLFSFNTAEGVKDFVGKIFYLLEHDDRDGKAKANKFELQAKGSPADLYCYIFGLEYLEPRYSLQLNGKSLEQLSPGERGTLLLIFYLMVDKDDRPLIVDQPEENLDNQTIFNVLVPCIKSAKKNRQLFLVTHNPNLAVVCDAEQIIVAKIDKANGNKVHYISGAIENAEVNKAIVDILEGTRPAFDNRDSKYHKATV